ncbi:MAG: hypothetical protein Q8942_14965 [Bacillota bacterium]|nr:hypothetical protein [Bacillota bacterium]
MRKFKVTTEGIIGCIFIISSGLLFTFERFLSIFKWIGQVAPVKINGSGDYPSNPTMPGLIDNIFVVLFLVIGLSLLVIGLFGKRGNDV